MMMFPNTLLNIAEKLRVVEAKGAKAIALLNLIFYGFCPIVAFEAFTATKSL